MATMFVVMMLVHAIAFAQERGIEVQGGAGDVFDSAEGPSVPAANAGVVAWLTRRWGIGHADTRVDFDSTRAYRSVR